MTKLGKDQIQQPIPQIEGGGGFSFHTSPTHYPEHYKAIKALQARIEADYTGERIPAAEILHDTRSEAERNRYRTILGTSGAAYFSGDRRGNGERIVIDSARADNFTESEIAALYGHEAAHDALDHNGAPEEGKPSPDPRAVEWYKRNPKGKEAQADHFGARYSSASDMAAVLKKIRAGLTNLEYASDYVSPLNPLHTHPSLDQRIKALENLTPEQLATPSERILFNNDGTIHQILPPIATPDVRNNDNSKPR